ncbi:hypothetical protein V6N13_097785 [Hibiscus sabdariffa]
MRIDSFWFKSSLDKQHSGSRWEQSNQFASKSLRIRSHFHNPILPSLRSDKEINQDDKFGGKSIEDPTLSDVQKEHEFLEDSPIEEDKGEKLNSEKTEEQHVNATASAAQKTSRDEVRPPPPFPQRLKKHKEDLQFQKFESGSYETIVVASEYCAGRIDLPMKKKDPGSFIIPCSIGNNVMGNA